jgi:hypothetical protein
MMIEENKSEVKNRLQESSVNNIMCIVDEIGNIGNNESFLIARSLSPK